jgi:hypothetical protein
MVTSRVSVLAFRSRPAFAPSRHGYEENSNARCVEESPEAADFAHRPLTTGCRFTKCTHLQGILFRSADEVPVDRERVLPSL